MQKGSIQDFSGLWIALVLLVGPILFYYTIIIPIITIKNFFTKNGNTNSRLLFFSFITIIPLIYFVLQSLVSKLELNWPIPIFFGGLFVYAINLTTNSYKKLRQHKVQIIYSFIIIIIITIQTFFKILPIEAKQDPTSRYLLYSCFDKNMKTYLEGDSLKDYRIISNNFQIPSMVNFLLKPQQDATCLSIDYHDTFYSFLYPDKDLVGQNYIYISKKNKFPDKLKKYFTEVKYLKSFSSLKGDKVIRTYSLWLVKNYKGKY